MSNSLPVIQRLLAFLVLFAALACAGPARAQDAYSIRLSAKPATILADGVTSTTVTAELRDEDGHLIPDGQVVNFSTTLGSIEAAGGSRGGQASVRLTSSSVPGAATVTATSGRASSETIVVFAAKLVKREEAVRSIVVRAKHLQYNELEDAIEAVENVRIRVGSVSIEADRAQVSMNTTTIVAQSQAGASSLLLTLGDTEYKLDKVRYNWESRNGYALGLADPYRGLFVLDGVGGTIKPDEGPAPTGVFDLIDLMPSPLEIRASRVTVMPGSEMQFARAEILLNGKKRLGLPFHVKPLGGARLEDAQYIGLSSRGPLLDLPYYVAAGEVGTSQLRFKYNAPEGLYGGTVPGWALDVISKYALGRSADGQLALTRVTSEDWGVYWSHNQTIDARTNGYFNLDTRSGGGLDRRYTLGNFSVYHQATPFTATLSGFVSDRDLNPYARLSIQSKPRPLGGGFRWNVGTRASRRWSLVVEDDPNDPTQDITRPITTDTYGVDGRISAPSLNWKSGGSLNASIGQGVSWTNGRAGRSLLGTVSVAQPLAGRGVASLTYNYSDYESNQTSGLNYLGAERQTVTATVSYGKRPRWRLYSAATLGLDQKSRNYRLGGSYVFSDLWSTQFNAGYFRQGLGTLNQVILDEDLRTYSRFNWEARITHQLGERALSLVYESNRGRIFLDYTPGRYF